jgi:glycosyltransferase involved in cell wall biosynthesis
MRERRSMNPLVSILIPAHNAEATIAETLRSAVGQTWQHKEIIVIDDGSTDRTRKIAQTFSAQNLKVVSTENRGLSAAVNLALSLSRGEYIQELDSDDILMADKIERQLATLRPGDSTRLLLSSPWAPFFHRTHGVHFIQNSLCEDLSPVEWLLRKMRDNAHMQNATWLVSRELVEAAGPWDETLHYDQDGEYFARVLLASRGARFVPGTGVLYRASGLQRISYLGNSDKKKNSMLHSMKLHIKLLRSLEDSERTRDACLRYLQNWYPSFYPQPSDLAAEMQAIAAQLGGSLNEPSLSPKYAWLKPIVGRNNAKWAQENLPQLKASCLRVFDKAMHKLVGETVPSLRLDK